LSELLFSLTLTTFTVFTVTQFEVSCNYSGMFFCRFCNKSTTQTCKSSDGRKPYTSPRSSM